MSFYKKQKGTYIILQREMDKPPANRIGTLVGEENKGIIRLENAMRQVVGIYEFNQRNKGQIFAQRASSLIDPSYYNYRCKEVLNVNVPRFKMLIKDGFEVFTGVMSLPFPTRTFFWRAEDVKNLADIVRYDRKVFALVLKELSKKFGKDAYILLQEEMTCWISDFYFRQHGGAGCKINFHVNVSIAIRSGSLPDLENLETYVSDLFWRVATDIVKKTRTKSQNYLSDETPIAEPGTDGSAFNFNHVNDEKLEGWIKYSAFRKKFETEDFSMNDALREVVGGTHKEGRGTYRGKSLTPHQLPEAFQKVKRVKGAYATAFLFCCWVFASGRTVRNSQRIKFPKPAKTKRSREPVCEDINLGNLVSISVDDL